MRYRRRQIRIILRASISTVLKFSLASPKGSLPPGRGACPAASSSFFTRKAVFVRARWSFSRSRSKDRTSKLDSRAARGLTTLNIEIRHVRVSTVEISNLHSSCSQNDGLGRFSGNIKHKPTQISSCKRHLQFHCPQCR
jgi:hypothetical protein